MTADADENYRCAPADVKLNKDRTFVEKHGSCKISFRIHYDRSI